MAKQDSERVVMAWFEAWQAGTANEAIASCFAEDLRFEAPEYTFTSRDQLQAFMAKAPNPWAEVELLEAHYTEHEAAILYEGRNDAGRTRVAEFMRIEEGRIVRVRVVHSPMPASTA